MMHSRRAVVRKTLAIAATATATDLDRAIKANAKIQASLLRQSSPVLAEQIKQNPLKVVTSFYDLASGIVSMLD